MWTAPSSKTINMFLYLLELGTTTHKLLNLQSWFQLHVFINTKLFQTQKLAKIIQIIVVVVLNLVLVDLKLHKAVDLQQLQQKI